jgi:hypothetical protein
MTIAVRKRRSRAAATMLAVVGVTALSALAGLAVACGDEQPAAPAGDPSITGVVTSADAGDGDAATEPVSFFLIDQGTGDYDKASVTVTDDTVWYSRDGDGFVTIERPKATELTGQTIEVQFTGAVAESYPVQATAGWVIVGD